MLNSYVKYIIDIDEKVGSFLILIMMSLTFLQVVMRYIFNAPLFWSEEVTIVLSIWVVFLGAGIASKRNLHIAIELWNLPYKGALVKSIIISSSIIFFCVVVIIGAIPLLIDLRTVKTPALRIPTSWIMISFPICAVVMIYAQLVAIIKDVISFKNIGKNIVK
jgi:TRAP-type C4-dicarboxylate transport system permease small subunit